MVDDAGTLTDKPLAHPVRACRVELVFVAINLMVGGQQRERDCVNEVMALWTQFAADETSLNAFVKAKRLECFD